MGYYPEPDCQPDKVKVVLDLSYYATKKKLDYTTGVDTSDLAAKIYFIALKAEIDKLDINKMTNVPTSLNNLEIKVDLKKLSGVVDNEVKNSKFNTLNTM